MAVVTFLDALPSLSLQVVLLRPPKWIERDTRQWLSSLSLDLLPDEEAASMLENPLRSVRYIEDSILTTVKCTH
jgi:hypothetical protein